MFKIGITEDFTVIHKDFAKAYYRDQVNELSPFITKPKALPKIKKLISKHSHFVPFYGMLISHFKSNDHEKAIYWMKKMYELFPDDLSAKIQMGQYYLLVEKNMDGIYDLFGKNIDLSYAAPERTIFHFAEFMDFVVFCTKALLKIDRVTDAERKLSEIAALGMNNPAYQECKFMIDNYKMTQTNHNAN